MSFILVQTLILVNIFALKKRFVIVTEEIEPNKSLWLLIIAIGREFLLFLYLDDWKEDRSSPCKTILAMKCR